MWVNWHFHVLTSWLSLGKVLLTGNPAGPYSPFCPGKPGFPGVPGKPISPLTPPLPGGPRGPSGPGAPIHTVKYVIALFKSLFLRIMHFIKTQLLAATDCMCVKMNPSVKM